MKLFVNKNEYIETDTGFDLSIPLRAGEINVNAWYANPVKITPVVTENFIGDVNKGGSVNFRDLYFNPHGNGTHTECVGHISKDNYTINQCLKEFHFKAKLISVTPAVERNQQYDTTDLVITRPIIE